MKKILALVLCLSLFVSTQGFALGSMKAGSALGKPTNKQIVALIQNAMSKAGNILFGGDEKDMIEMEDGIYFRLAEKYNTKAKIASSLSPYFAASAISTFDERFISTVNEKLCVAMVDGLSLTDNMKITKATLNGNKLLIKYTYKTMHGDIGINNVTFVKESGKWKVLKFDGLLQ